MFNEFLLNRIYFNFYKALVEPILYFIIKLILKNHLILSSIGNIEEKIYRKNTLYAVIYAILYNFLSMNIRLKYIIN